MRRALVLLRRATLAAGAVATAAVAWVALPIPRSLVAPPPSASVTLLDRHGRPLRTARSDDGSDRRWVPLAAIDPDVVRSFIALEDNRFYDHGGVDLRAAIRAARDNLRARHVVSGASTITMQLARLLVGAPRSWWGKIRQSAWAVRLEAHLSKQQILEQYLNRIPLGLDVIGVGAASDRYFAAAPDRLSLAEGVLLASLARAPSRDNPFDEPARARQRRDEALGRLRARGMISGRDSAEAADEPVITPRAAHFDAPHFTTRVLASLDAENATHRRTPPAGPPARQPAVRTTLDLSLQEEVESEVRHTVAFLHDVGAHQAAAVVLENATGGILAWVGSPDFLAPDHGQVDMVVSPRQPGSALKPFLYGMAFDHGYSPASVLPDVPRTYATTMGSYHPRNYDRRFHGPVSVREALGSSHNVPAVELTARLGPSALLATLRRAGFTSLDRPAEYYGLGLALGNGDVTLIELANAYRSLVNEGVWRPWTWTAGEAVVANGATATRGTSVMSPVAAALVLDILADPVARIPGFGVQTPFDFPFPAAVKTGTSRNFTDNWAIAVTGGFTVAVWVGDFEGRPMHQVSGITGAGPLLQRVVLRVARRYPPRVLPTPADAGARAVTICRISGELAGPQCPTRTEWVPPTAVLGVCDWHRDGRLVLPPVYAEWANTLAVDASTPTTRTITSTLRITSPLDGDRYAVPPGTDPRFATLGLRAAAPADAGDIRWYIDGHPLPAARWRLEAGPHVVRAVAADGRSDEVRIVVDDSAGATGSRAPD